ncbi:protein diaphanous homolog 1 isoform X2 [Calonectris borealis]|uniref:protein diaphanous homolog 1 isoform X2 n=1 Tax=Calonectris borealis TaxID=1323832 RepID=UPI003F4BC32F
MVRRYLPPVLPHCYKLADECDSQIIAYKNGADPDFRCKHLGMNPERWIAGLGTDCTEELQIEMKKTKRDFEEKLLDAHGGKEMLDVEKQQMTAEKQELASSVSHLNGEAERRS